MKSVCITALCAVALDQLSKAAALRFLRDAPPRVVIPDFFNLRFALNDGAAWSMLSGQRVLLCCVSLAMLAFLWFNRKDLVSSGISRFATGILAGGITGNLIDRAFRGVVVDFLDFHWRSVYTYPTFNVADSCICVGIAILLIVSLKCSRAER